MPDRRSTTSPDHLKQILAKLDEVMTEAQRLRSEVTRQLSEERRAHLPNVPHRRPKPPKKH